MITDELVLSPFPHIIWTNLFDPELLQTARGEFDSIPDPYWVKYDNSHERKWAITFAGAGPACNAVAEYLQSKTFIDLLQETFSIDGLSYSDLGGGLHRILPGGMLDVHVDFNIHEDGRYRRLNVLTYLNSDPDPSGDLWLCQNWPQTEATIRVPAKLGHTVAFVTSDTSWHGHPTALVGNERRSLAAYYYTAQPPEHYSSPHSTIFKN